MSENKNGLNDFLFGFFLGGAIGAVTALLLAPAKGKDTREAIGKKFHELSDEGKAELIAMKEFVKNEVQNLSEKKEALKEGIEKGVETYKSHGKNTEI